MATIFSTTLIKARKESGFPTAYRFYHDNGGASVLKMSYRTYLMIEQGKTLPDFGRLRVFLSAMRMTRLTPLANELVTAWLEVLVGEDSYAGFLKPLISAPTGGLSPLHEAMKNTLTQRRYNLTMAQFRAIMIDFNTYLCHMAISNDSGEWSPETIAKALKLKVPEAKIALETLTRVKLLKKLKKGHYLSPLASATIVYPHGSLLTPDFKRRLLDYHKELTASGRCVWRQLATVRVDSLDFRRFFPLLEQDIETAANYAVTKRTPASAIYEIEAKITKLRDF